MPNTIRHSLAAEIEALAATAPDSEARDKLRGIANTLATKPLASAAKPDDNSTSDEP